LLLHRWRTIPFWILLLAGFTLTACDVGTTTPSTFGQGIPLASPAQTGIPCGACAQATFAAALTQEKNNANNQAAATAEVLRANAQSTLDSANATLSVALTQEQNNADFVAAQIASTAAIERANAQATLNSAGSTQSAAMTQSQYALQVTMAAGTQVAQAMVTQQSKDDFAHSTQTAIANVIATQTRSAIATSEWYLDQDRQRKEQRQGSIAFLWMWCLPVFVILIAGLILWGFWRWLKIQQSNQLILGEAAVKLLPPASEIINRQPYKVLPYIDSYVVEKEDLPLDGEDQIPKWLDEVKDKLLRSEEKEQDDKSDE
jgi:hypothetical protein